LNAAKQAGPIDAQKNNLLSNSSFFQSRSASPESSFFENRSATSKPTFFQAKLTIGPVDDPYEREADAVADRIIGMPDKHASPADSFTANNTAAKVQRKCQHCDEEEKLQRKSEAGAKEGNAVLTDLFSVSNAPTKVQRKCQHCEQEEKLQRKNEAGATEANVAPSIINEVTSSGGQPLDAGARSFFEPRFGRDFSQVRVHTDNHAAESAKAVQAHAYTVGNHVVFGSNQFDTASAGGRRLLAHELTHTIQQAPTFNRVIQPKLTIGAVNTPAENEAESGAEQVTTGATIQPITQINTIPTVSRQANDAPGATSEKNFDSPQKRGGQPRAAFVDAPSEGDDQVQVAVTRYLCNCKLSNFTEKHASGNIFPKPGFSLEFCNGRFSAHLTGKIEPQTITTGTGTLSGEINIAPGSSGIGVKIGTDGKVSNEGTEPTVTGTGSVNVGKPGGLQVGTQVDIEHGLNTGKNKIGVQGGLNNVFGKGTTLGVKVDDVTGTPNYSLVFQGTIGKEVDKKTCRQCRCPSVYCCIKDVKPRKYEVPHVYDVEEKAPLRYYFSLDTDRDTNEPTLKAQSRLVPDDVSKRVKDGAKIGSIVGYASPEDNRDRPVPNEQLSLSRAKKLRDLLASKLGSGVTLPEPQAGGELLGRTSTILPGSGLSDAITDSGFKGPEEFSDFLIGSDIPNQQLSDQFLALLNHEKLQDPAARLSLFGIDSSSPAAPKLLAAINTFIASKGRGARPWEHVFSFLRFATVQLVTTHQETYNEDKYTSGSLTPMTDDSLCNSFAYDAESKGLFGPADPEPANENDCEKGQSGPAKGDDKNTSHCSNSSLTTRCDYSS
jgi:hypothetical protein